MNITEEKTNFIDVKSQINWDEYFMLQAMLASFRSKDPSSKVGCVFVDENNHQVTMGYNGMVAGIDEDKIPWGRDTSVGLEFQKYGYVVHSEANAIMHANRPLEGCRVYVTLFPCNECAKLIASKKIKEVIFLSDKYKDTENNRIARRIFKLANIPYRQLIPSDQVLEMVNGHFKSLKEKES